MTKVTRTEIVLDRKYLTEDKLIVFSLKNTIIRVAYVESESNILYLDKIFNGKFTIESVSNNSIREQIFDYLRGKIKRFDLEPFIFSSIADKKSLPPKFSMRVYKECMAIPYGEIITYTMLAKRAGNPKASRAVGTILSKNPVPLIIPCHRVVATKSLGGYTSPKGLRTKQAILLLESKYS